MAKSHTHHKSTANLLGTALVLCLFAGCCTATLDLSNLDFKNFEFFRYQKELPNGEYQKVRAPPSSISSQLAKTKAVGVFVHRLLFGNTGDSAKDVPIVFPAEVNQLRERFQRQHGYRGEHLIEQLGNGRFRFSHGYIPCYSCRHR